MDRPKGDGQLEASAVTVVDLSRRQRQPVRIPSADEVDTTEFVGDLLGPEPGADEPRRGWAARAAKLIGLATGSLVLCGSVVAASTLAHDRKGGSQLNPPPAEITGGSVLRPDTILAQLSGPPRTTRPTPATSAPRAKPTTRTAAAPEHTSVNPPEAPADLRPDQVVREFYALARQQPAEAASLLDPSLLADPLGFDQSWTAVRGVRVSSLQTAADGTVRTVIELLPPEGTWLQVAELLHVSQGADPVINGAELLSAQRG